MRTRFSLDNPDELMATLTHTITIREWKELREQLSDDKYVGNDFIRQITGVIAAAEKHFCEYDVPKEGGG